MTIDTDINPLKVFEKLINLDEFLHHLKLESERYTAQNGETFEVSMDELRAFISVNFVKGYHKLPNQRSYRETGSPSLSVNFDANVMTRERFKKILGNLHFSNNEDVVPRDHPAHDRAFKMRWLIDYFNELFLSLLEPEVEQSVGKHMIKYKGRSITREHIKSIPVKWGFIMWYRCAPKTGYLYEFDIYTGRKETTEFGLGESVVLQLTEKLNGSFCRIFFDNFFTLPSLLRKFTDNSLYCTGQGLFDKTKTCYRKLKNRQRRNLKQKRNRRSSKSQKNSFMGHHRLLVKNLIVEIATTS